MSWDLFQNTFQKKFAVMVIAHRGARYEAPENSLRAFELAIDAGAEMIEFDVHKTIDNHVVVIHDRTTTRTAKMTINVEKSTLEQVRAISSQEESQIPTLEEVFAQFKGKLYFQIEIKQKGMESYILDLIEKYNLHDQCVISSFLHSTLHYFKKSKKKVLLASLEPTLLHLPIQKLIRKWMVKNTINLELDGFHPNHLMVTPELVSYAHSNNLFVNPWTADTPKYWSYLIKCGVDGIMTNYPRALYKFLESR